jgi:hypothetical protein
MFRIDFLHNFFVVPLSLLKNLAKRFLAMFRMTKLELCNKSNDETKH